MDVVVAQVSPEVVVEVKTPAVARKADPAVVKVGVKVKEQDELSNGAVAPGD